MTIEDLKVVTGKIEANKDYIGRVVVMLWSGDDCPTIIEAYGRWDTDRMTAAEDGMRENYERPLPDELTIVTFDASWCHGDDHAADYVDLTEVERHVDEEWLAAVKLDEQESK